MHLCRSVIFVSVQDRRLLIQLLDLPSSQLPLLDYIATWGCLSSADGSELTSSEQEPDLRSALPLLLFSLLLSPFLAGVYSTPTTPDSLGLKLAPCSLRTCCLRTRPLLSSHHLKPLGTSTTGTATASSNCTSPPSYSLCSPPYITPTNCKRRPPHRLLRSLSCARSKTLESGKIVDNPIPTLVIQEYMTKQLSGRSAGNGLRAPGSAEVRLKPDRVRSSPGDPRSLDFTSDFIGVRRRAKAGERTGLLRGLHQNVPGSDLCDWSTSSPLDFGPSASGTSDLAEHQAQVARLAKLQISLAHPPTTSLSKTR